MDQYTFNFGPKNVVSIMGEDSLPILELKNDGTINIQKGYTPERAAGIFWKSLNIPDHATPDTTPFIVKFTFSNDLKKTVSVGVDGFVEYGKNYKPEQNAQLFWEAIELYCPVNIGTRNSPYGAI